ncbi:MAG: dTDP-4-dehydrorhamnose 3,5-epimerase [Pedosphaera sp.]|nr:dTDP-4-dehydrorhamnose 3,5-epimerase [Pedosphaera sp.]
MIFTTTRINNVWVIDLEKHADERGFFARTWCQEEFQKRGLNPRLVQCGVSRSTRRGTLRGMHFQTAPHEEAKLVRCTRGAIFDVAVDLHRSSPTFRQWVAIELSADNGRMIYIGEGCAHGFQTLTDDTEVAYQMSEFFHPESSRGVRWNDPAFSIEWPPCEHRILSERDANFSDFAC